MLRNLWDGSQKFLRRSFGFLQPYWKLSPARLGHNPISLKGETVCESFPHMYQTHEHIAWWCAVIRGLIGFEARQGLPLVLLNMWQSRGVMSERMWVY